MAAVVAGYRKGLVSDGWPVLLSSANECRKRSFHLVGNSISGFQATFSAWRLLQLAIERAWLVLDESLVPRPRPKNLKRGLVALPCIFCACYGRTRLTATVDVS